MGNAMYRNQVTNKEYQSWTGYPDSIVKTVDFPYQSLAWSGGVVRLYCSSVPLKVNAGHTAFQVASTVIDGHYLIWQYNPSGATWVYYTDGWYMGIAAIEQANHDVCEQDGTTVYFAKTTTTEQDAGTSASLIRIRNLRHKDGASFIRDKAAFWLEESASGYQKWPGRADSPFLTASYPYQWIYKSSTKAYMELVGSPNRLYKEDLNRRVWTTLLGGVPINTKRYYSTNSGVTWLNNGDNTISTEDEAILTYSGGTITSYEANNNIYDASYGTPVTKTTNVVFAKTTTPAQYAGISETLHCINI